MYSVGITFDGQWYRVRCSCGWEGKAGSNAGANLSATEHLQDHRRGKV